MAWASATLATNDDVRDRYKNVGELTGESTEAEQNTVIDAYIEKAKDYIGRELDVVLKPMHADYDYDTTDLKDLINNPSVFKYACVAWTLKLMFEDNAFNEDDFNHQKMSDFEKEFKREFAIARQLVEFDKDESGDIDQEEEAGGIGSNHFFRV